MAVVKVCPVCDADNSPSAQRCAACGTMLMGVDLSERATANGDCAAPQVASTQAASTVPRAGSPGHLPRKCPHADCGQLNAADAIRCVYCNRPLEEAPRGVATLRAAIRWPWTEEIEIRDTLVIGREAPAPPALVARLEREYPNVSRRHAELRLSEGALWIIDLASSNGTFVNETRLTPHQRVRLANGARLRFAADLVAHVTIGNTTDAGERSRHD